MTELTEREATKQRIKERLEVLEFLIGTTPPDQDDEYFVWLLDEQSLLKKFTRT